jgi:hypothetical protein
MDAPAELPPRSPLQPVAACGLLPHMGLLRFSGPDAASFLQGQVSNDTRRLAGGTPLLAAFSTPQGRVVAVLHLVPHSSGIIALLPRELVAPVRERLRKYVLRAKVNLEDLTGEFLCFGLQPAPATTLGIGGSEAPDIARAYVECAGVGVARIGADASRCWVIGNEGSIAALPPGWLAAALANPPAQTGSGGRPSEAERHWRLADIRAGIPQVYGPTSEMFVAQMLNLDLIDGISFTKGCFAGQEIIARTQHLGRIKRRMHRLRLPAGGLAIGQQLMLPDGRSGRVTEVADAGGHFEALAVLNTDIPAPGSSAEAPPHSQAAVDATELPLPYPL